MKKLVFLSLFLISYSSAFGQKTKPKGGPAQWGSIGGHLIFSDKYTFTKTTGRSDKKSGQISRGKITVLGPGFLGYFVRKIKTVNVRFGWNAYDYPSNQPTNMGGVALGERRLLKDSNKNWVWEPNPAVMAFVDPKTPNFIIDGRTVTLDIWVHAGDSGVHAQVYQLPEPVGIEYDIWFFPRKGGKVIKVVDVNGKNITNIDPGGGTIIVKPDPDPDPGTGVGNINVNLIADSHVYAYSYLGWNKANWGKYEFIGAGWNPTGGEKRAFLKFAFPGIKSNSVKKATLRLYHNHTGGGNAVDLGVYRVMSPWIEGRGTIKPATPAMPGEITWVNQPKIDQYPVVYFNPGKGVNKWVEIDVTPLVKSWLNGIPNHGMVIKGGENLAGKPESQYGFYSREYKEIDKRPQLILNSNAGGENPDFSNALGKPIASDKEFVRSLYQSVLGRDLEVTFEVGHGAAHLRSLKNGNSRLVTILAFFNSPEYKNKQKSGQDFMRDAYQAVLGREPRGNEAKQWPRIERDKIIENLFNSNEYKNLTKNGFSK